MYYKLYVLYMSAGKLILPLQKAALSGKGGRNQKHEIKPKGNPRA